VFVSVLQICRAAVTGAICIALVSCERQGPYTVGANGFGPVTIGMTIADAEKRLGVELRVDDYGEGEDCRYYTPKNAYRGLSFMASSRKIVRVDVFGGDDPERAVTIATDEGVRTGDHERRALSVYKGHIKVSPHFYGGLPSHYLRVYDSAGRIRLIFETNGEGVITSYRAGREPEIEYVEGCV
jgi:hypothetical protein